MIYAVKEKVKEWSYKNDFADYIFHIARRSLMNIMRLRGIEGYAKWFYKTYTGEILNLKNPRTYNEKLWWLKLHNRDPQMAICSDKNKARQYVSKCGYGNILIPQLNVYESANDISFSKFTEEVILKCNHGSGGNFLYSPGMQINEKRIKAMFRRSLKEKSHMISLEYNYKNITPQIVVERVIRDSKGNLPIDYRFFCFNGVPKILMIDLGVLDNKGIHRHHYPRCILDMNFEELPMEFGRESYHGEVEKPENFDRMIEIAEVLSRPFVHCRVDLYNVEGQIYFGECTFYHGGACQRISPREWETILGDWIDLRSEKVCAE